MAWLGRSFNAQYVHFVGSEYWSISNNTKIVPKRVDFPTESEFWHYLKTLMWKQWKSMDKSGTAHSAVLGTLSELHLQTDRSQCTRVHFSRRILHICSPTVHLLVNLLFGCPLMGDPTWRRPPFDHLVISSDHCRITQGSTDHWTKGSKQVLCLCWHSRTLASDAGHWEWGCVSKCRWFGLSWFVHKWYASTDDGSSYQKVSIVGWIGNAEYSRTVPNMCAH